MTHRIKKTWGTLLIKVLEGTYGGQPGKQDTKGKEDTPSKRGSSLRNYLDQTQSSEIGQKEEGESHLGDDHGAYIISIIPTIQGYLGTLQQGVTCTASRTPPLNYGAGGVA